VIRKKPSNMWAIQQETPHCIGHFIATEDETAQRINEDMKIKGKR
jgi:hypothetical protein